MQGNICLLGLNHKTAPVEVREKLAFSQEELPKRLRELVSLPHISEGVILSTCNRVEVYYVSGDIARGKEEVERFLLRGNEEWKRYLYFKHGKEVPLHLFSVASGLDSMVLGEPQILGQVKDAYREATKARTTLTILNKLFHWAFRAAKEVRRRTKIGESAVSVSYAAFELAKGIFDTFQDKNLLMVGAGEMIELALRYFVDRGVGKIFITNRTFSRAEELCKEFGGEPIPFEVFKNYLHQMDIVLTCTGSMEPIISREDIEKAMKKRKGKPIFIIDIAVPRDVDEGAKHIDGVFLFDIDDLKEVVERNLKEREKEALSGRKIVEEEAEKFMAWLGSLEAVPIIVRVKDFFEEVRKEELEEALGKLKGLGEREKEVLDKLTEAICNKIFHRIAVAAKNGDPRLREAISRIFLEEELGSKVRDKRE